MARTTRTPLTDEEKTERRRRDLERFELATRELLTSDGWARWLRTRARFRTYCTVISMTGVIDPV